MGELYATARVRLVVEVSAASWDPKTQAAESIGRKIY